MTKYLAILEPANDGTWSAYVPDLPGCVCSAPTSAAAAALIGETIAFHIEGLRAHGDPVPAPSSLAEVVAV